MTILPMWLPGRHQPEGVESRSSRVNSVTGSTCSSPSRARGEDLLEEPAVPVGLQPQIQVEIDHREGRALRQCGQPQRGVGVDVLLAQFDESATGGQDLHASTNRFSGQRIENDVDTVAVRGGEYLIGEVDAS